MKAAADNPENTASRRTTRRAWLLGAVACGVGTGWGTLAQAVSPKTMVEVWKDPNCGCCKDWMVHLERAGFAVKAHDKGNNAVRAALGMPQRLGSCHTALVQGYVIEGHVPASDIQRLLAEKPQALGLAVPGMPLGSPGMDGPEYQGRRDAYQVLLVQKGGTTKVFNSYT